MTFSSKAWLRAAKRNIEKALEEIELVRDHFDCERGKGRNSDLDVDLTVGVVMNLEDAKEELNKILLRFRGKLYRSDFRKKVKKGAHDE